MEFKCFAQRLLNPFRGVMHSIQYGAAEAVTTDGVQWDIYVSNDELKQDLLSVTPIQTSDIRYGSWSAAAGLKRGPIYPSDDFKRMEAMGAAVYEKLLEIHDTVPFPLQDHYELWLLDQQQLPLALLHSVVDEGEIELDIPLTWRAGQSCQKLFRPETVYPKIEDSLSAAEVLANTIHHNANAPNLQAQWFLRQADGSGQAIATINCDAPLGRILHENEFGTPFINQQRIASEYHNLFTDYKSWLSPWLLLLPQLNDMERAFMEQQCRANALAVATQYRLYPKVIDPSIIKAARVEAMLRNTQPAEEDKEAAISTWYLELGEFERGK